MAELGVNIDHVATLRQARRTYEPDPLWAAVEAQLGGADGITVHLREDRRHIQDHDVERIKAACHVKLNLELAATNEMIGIACRIKPHQAMLVPEGRQEITTEGGLDVAGQMPRLRDIVAQIHEQAIVISCFIDADAAQIDAAANAGFDVCEIHTGPYARTFHAVAGNCTDSKLVHELERVADAGRRITQANMRFNAGHGLNYVNVRPIAVQPDVCELHIGHAIVSRSVFVGIREAVAQMKQLILT